ncbi:MAG: hypothetical protein ACYC27_19725 [Armatimonadota bacterium]
MKAYPIILIACICILAANADAAKIGSPVKKVDTFNYVIGTQIIGGSYQFTDEPMIVEAAKAVLDMGSNVAKFQISKTYGGKKSSNVPELNPSINSLVELARDEPAHRKVFDMPFAYYIIWTYPFDSGWWYDGLSEDESKKEYKEIYDLACHLLKTYSGTSKTFFIGHWEGDWHLRPNFDMNADIPPTAIQGMIDWLNIRQKAIDDARRDTKHKDVTIYNYTEVNLTQIGMQGKQCLTTDVLPKTNVDYVSYSSYDSLSSPATLKSALDFIESKLKPKAGIPGKRVFIGEYGFHAVGHSPEKQDELSRQVMRTALDWGCPFALYWELFNNEIGKDGSQTGFWLIDDKGVKQPVYYTHQNFYKWAKKYSADFTAKNKRKPTFDEFRKSAVKYLDSKASDK